MKFSAEKDKKNLCIIVRSCGERTTELCESLIKKSIHRDNLVYVIKDFPFLKVLKIGYKKALQANCKWTIFIDGNVLPFSDSISLLCDFADQMDEKQSVIQGLVFKKFFNLALPSGNKLYRTSCMEKLIDLVETQNIEACPETLAITKLSLHYGYDPINTVPIFFGLHDYEQYYYDIYRKAFNFSRGIEKFLPYLTSFWRTKKDDLEFKIALTGLADGIKNYDIGLDKLNSNSILMKEGFKLLKLQEKERLIDNDFFSNLTRSILETNHEINSFELTMMESMHALNNVRTKNELFQIAVKNTLSSDHKDLS